jgi:hypothetical protein
MTKFIANGNIFHWSLLCKIDEKDDAIILVTFCDSLRGVTLRPTAFLGELFSHFSVSPQYPHIITGTTLKNIFKRRFSYSI